jgi:high affinity sulfate transporter 1
MKRSIDRFFPGLQALAKYDRSWLPIDLVAGLSVGAVAIPVAIAYAQLAGAPAVNGLYTGILPLLAYAIFGTSRQLIIAPDAATCAIVAAIVVPLAGADPGRYVSLSMILAVITGVACIVAGFARLGFLSNFLARPILTGYLNGIAISIISGQLGKLFGYSLKPVGFFRQMAEFVSKLGETRPVTLAVGLGAFALLRVMRRGLPKFPAPLIAMVVGIALSGLLRLGDRGVALLGTIPAGLPAPKLPDLGTSELEPLVYGALGLALISFNSAMVTARGFAAKNRYDIDPNQEFIALGVADIGAGVMQGFAVSGADSRTAVNDSVGGKSQVVGLVAAVVLVLTLLFLTGPLAALPIAVLAAVLIDSAIGLFDLPSLVRLRRVSPHEFRLCLITLLGVITVGVVPGVGIAVAVALFQLIRSTSRPHDAVLGRIPGIEGYHDMSRNPAAEPIPGLVIFRFDSPLVFVNADRFKARVRQVVERAGSSVRCLILDAGIMPNMDTTGAAALGEVRAELAANNVTLLIAEPVGRLRDMIEKTAAEEVRADVIFPTVDDAVAQWEERSRRSIEAQQGAGGVETTRSDPVKGD